MYVESLVCFGGWYYILNVLRRELTQPHFDLIDFHVTESQTVLNASKGEAKPARADAHGNRVPEGKAKSLPAHGKEQILGECVCGEGLLVPFKGPTYFILWLPFTSPPLLSCCRSLRINSFIQFNKLYSLLCLLWGVQRWLAFMEAPPLFWTLWDCDSKNAVHTQHCWTEESLFTFHPTGQSESIGILHKVKSQKYPTLSQILIFYAIV